MVLGMHRSGTSAVARVISLLGADLPHSLMPPTSANERGYWESNDLMVIHDALLSSGGSNWHDWRAFNPEWYTSPAAPVFRHRILEVLRRDLGSSRLFVIKDPRICRFWPLWRDVLEEFGATPGVVIPVRNPLEVMASLKRRDGFVSAKSCLIWLRHVVDAESATRGLPRAVVTYDALLEDWQGVVSALGSRLGVHWPRRGSIAELEIERFLATQFRHHAIAPEQLAARAEVVDWVKEAFAALVQMSVTPEHKASMTRLDRVRAEFEKASAAFGVALADGETELAKREAEYVQLRAASGALQQRIAELDEQRRQSGDAEAAAAKSKEELASARTALAALETARAVAEATHAEVAEDARRLRSELESFGATLSAERQKAAENGGRLAALESARTIAEASHAAAVEEARQLRSELQNLGTALSAERQKAAEHAGRLADLENTRTIAEASHAAVAEEARQLRSEREALQKRVSALAHEQQRLGADAEASTARLKKALETAHAKLSAERQRAAEQDDRLAYLDAARSDAEASHAAAALEAWQLRAERDGLRQRVSDLSDEAAHLKQSLERANAEQADRLADLEASHAAGTEEARQLHAELAVQARVAAELSGMIGSWRLAHSRAEQENADLARRIDELDSAVSGEKQTTAATLARVADLEFALAAKTGEMRDVGSRAEHVEASLESARRELHAIKRTLAWRLTTPVRRIAAKLQRRSDLKLIAASGAFDRDWYLENYPDIRSTGVDPALHYLEYGASEGRDPNPLFDSDWYLEQYPDVRAAGLNPLIHYLRHGAVEGRDPIPLFDSDWYLYQYSDVRAAGVNPLVHYLRHGAMEGRDPIPLFDSDWYLEKYSDVRAAGLNPLVHYLRQGSLERRNPSPLFDTEFYLRANPDMVYSKVDPLSHFRLFGFKERERSAPPV